MHTVFKGMDCRDNKELSNKSESCPISIAGVCELYYRLLMNVIIGCQVHNAFSLSSHGPPIAPLLGRGWSSNPLGGWRGVVTTCLRPLEFPSIGRATRKVLSWRSHSGNSSSQSSSRSRWFVDPTEKGLTPSSARQRRQAKLVSVFCLCWHST